MRWSHLLCVFLFLSSVGLGTLAVAGEKKAGGPIEEAELKPRTDLVVFFTGEVKLDASQQLVCVFVKHERRDGMICMSPGRAAALQAKPTMEL